MTDNDTPTTSSEADSTPAADTTAQRAITRTRTRTRSRDAAAADTATADDSSAGAPEPDIAGDDGSDTRKRRRRGGRGRGRRGRKSAETTRAPADDTAPAAGSAADDASSDAAGSPEPARSNDRNGDSDGSKADTSRTEVRSNGDGPDDEDSDGLEQAIAAGGTRVAARRSRGSSQERRGPRVGGVPEDVRRAMVEGPPRTMLVTAGDDRTQIAVLEDRTVVEHYVTRKNDVTYVGNIYMARVQNVLPGMEAAFLDIGKGRNGVLYAGEVLYDELDLEEGASHRIENALKPGQKVLVQVTKDPMGTKGPRLTMHLSLAGRYMVIAPNSDLFGISRKLTDRERDRLRKIVKKHKPDEHGVIVRTAAEGATEEQLAADIERLLAKWAKVEEAAEQAKALDTVYEEPPLVVKVIRDNFGPEFVRCVVDDDDLYQQVCDYLEQVAPELLDKVELYGQPREAPAQAAEGADADTAADQAPDDTTGDGADSRDAPAPAEQAPAAPQPGVRDDIDAEEAAKRREELAPLFEAYDVSEQLRKAMARKVWLPSGGYLIIESTEAMKVIDVNTGKFTGDADTNLEEVVLKTNLEAADEIVRQLRLRDMGGIIIIDFIDMLLKANQDQVVRRLKRELLRDRTKTRVSEVSRLGLVQMTRKNVSQGLVESFSRPCDVCEGRGLISELE